ncbi:MAG: MgtC/SapB family protein [Eubacteriales bacterium]|nr:MgtC/SapB family protein [Eubacteriales bacterium]
MDGIAVTLNEMNIVSTCARLGLALLLGGILGVERGRKRRPAGLRTYMIVCMASALVMMTGEHLFVTLNTGDPARLGAQVISGIGFLGAGTIIITSKQVKGLTTAAGLWASACLGLAVGAGYYSGAIICGMFLLVVFSAMSRLDTRLRINSKQINFFAEFQSMEAVGAFIQMMRDKNYKIYDVEINRSKDTVGDLVGATFWVDLNERVNHIQVIGDFSRFKGVRYMEELEVM